MEIQIKYHDTSESWYRSRNLSRIAVWQLNISSVTNAGTSEFRSEGANINIQLLTGFEDNSSFVWPEDGSVARSRRLRATDPFEGQIKLLFSEKRMLFVSLFGTHSRIIWRRQHYRWRAANFDLFSALRAIEGSLACNTYCDTNTYSRSFSSGAVTFCFNDWGLSRPWFEHQTFHVWGERSNKLCSRRGKSDNKTGHLHWSNSFFRKNWSRSATFRIKSTYFVSLLHIFLYYVYKSRNKTCNVENITYM